MSCSCSTCFHAAVAYISDVSLNALFSCHFRKLMRCTVSYWSCVKILCICFAIWEHFKWNTVSQFIAETSSSLLCWTSGDDWGRGACASLMDLMMLNSQLVQLKAGTELEKAGPWAPAIASREFLSLPLPLLVSWFPRVDQSVMLLLPWSQWVKYLDYTPK